MLTQRAAFRVILRDGRQHALAWQLTMRGEGIYAGPPRSARGDEFRQSYHASGAGHIHLWGGSFHPERRLHTDCRVRSLGIATA